MTSSSLHCRRTSSLHTTIALVAAVAVAVAVHSTAAAPQSDGDATITIAGQQCKCVPFYLCDSSNTIDVPSGSTETGCGDSVCCQVQSDLPLPPVTESYKPSSELPQISSSTQEPECFTPNDLNGNCINIKRCPTLLSLLQNQRHNASIAIFLRNSKCGYEGKDPKVCCPLENERTSTSNYATETSQRITTLKPDSTGSAIYETVSSIKLPSQKTCGRSNSTHVRIVGGGPAELGAWPWMAALGYQDLNRPTTEYQWLCGGALISDRYVLTAAHCTVDIGNRKLAVAHLGDLNLDPKVNDSSGPIDVAITRIITHERYNAQEHTTDIALLKLENSVRFNQFIQPICLPILSHHRANKLVKSVPFVAGWGSTSFRGPSSTHLMEVKVPVMDNSECKRAFANKKSVIDDRVLCAGILTGGKDACQGDSGGPLMWPSGSQYYLVGVVSYGFKCAEPGYPGVYTRVASFVEWIADNMKNS